MIRQVDIIVKELRHLALAIILAGSYVWVETVLGKKHPSTSTSMKNLASVFKISVMPQARMRSGAPGGARHLELYRW